MKFAFTFAATALLLSACGTPDENDSAAETAMAPPATETEEKAATQAPDPHLWLEAIEDEEALDWVRAQNKRSLAELEGDERFPALYEDALAILNSDARIPYGQIHGDHVFNFWQDAEHVRGVWRRASLASYKAGAPQWKTLLDVDALDEKERQNWIYVGYTCLSPEYEHCMVMLSRGGTDASVAREFSVSNSAFVPGGFEIPQAKSSVDWADKDTLLVGTDWGDESMTTSGYARIVKVWKRGTPLASAETMFEGEPSDVGVFATVNRDGDDVYKFAQRVVTFFETERHWQLPSGETRKLPLPLRSSVLDIMDGRVIATLDTDWSHQGVDYPQGALVALTVSDMSAELVFAPGDGQAINEANVGKSSVFVELLDNVIGKIKRLRRTDAGWVETDLALPGNGVTKISSVNSKGDDLLVSYESMTVPDSLYYIDADDKVTEVASLPAMYPSDNVVVEQRFATSKDGTRVPYFIMADKDVLAAGNAPTVQYGYGGFQASILPYYYSDPARPQHGALAGRMWVMRGGVLVITNMRGGGEYGPAWHEASLKLNRHKAFEDFFAVSEDLVATGVTSPKKLGAIGRSNGGLLMGVAMIQRPNYYAAIDCGVPLLDMLRYHKLLAGASWMGEYGDPDVPEERAYLESYSPYQNLQKDALYPPVFFYTSTKDDRVHPGHARKMAAKMESYGHPFLYYENIEGGHGGTANQNQLARRTALEYMFFMRELM